jgi:hypothetical protein
MGSALSPRTAAIASALAVVAAGLGSALLVGCGDDDSSGGEESVAEPAAPTDGPVAADLERLQGLGDAVGHPVYWAGEQPDGEYELTIEEDGTVFVRYLGPETALGSQELSLTVATYTFPGAFEALGAVARKPGATTGEAPEGGIVVSRATTPTSAYLAYPDSDLQIEVFDPDPGTAFELAASGSVVPIE